jgi:D-beta-D-heptose 7-phosphate kinase/D-beta-D-heptose 1-phosphate adenosyltransferase
MDSSPTCSAWLAGLRRIRAVPLSEIQDAVHRWRSAGETVAFTNGCFDLLHAGHLKVLREASEEGDRLIVAINSDSSVRALKGTTRPIQPESVRCQLIAEMRCVDAVVCFDQQDPGWLVKMLRPDVMVKGADYRNRTIAGSEYGARVHFVELVDGVSTTVLVTASEAGSSPRESCRST